LTHGSVRCALYLRLPFADLFWISFHIYRNKSLIEFL
jgi:hypothetical protein